MSSFFPPNGSADGITSITGDGTATGPGAAALALDATLTTAKINVATSSLKGAMSAADKVILDAAVKASGAAFTLTDASVTVQPLTSKYGRLILPVGTLTANRTVSLGISGNPGTGPLITLDIERYDASAFTLAITTNGGATIYTFPANPTKATRFACYLNVGSGVWTANTLTYING